MLGRLVGHLNDEQVVEALQAAVENVVTHGVVEKINDLRVVAIGIRENEFFSRDEHYVVEEDEVPGVVAERVPHVIMTTVVHRRRQMPHLIATAS